MSKHQATPQVLHAMLKKARQKLAAARKDMEFGFFGEASSRAYYAAFHAVSAVLPGLFLSRPDLGRVQP